MRRIFIIIFVLGLLLFFPLWHMYVLASPTNALHTKLQIIDIFKKKVSKTSPLHFKSHRLAVGENLWNLSRIHGLNVDTVVSVNRMENIHVIREGEEILLPNVDGLLKIISNKQSLNQIISNLSIEYDQEMEDILFFNPGLSNRDAEKKIFIPHASYSLKERIAQLGLEFFKPLSKFRITGNFGYRIHPITKKRSFHKGIDLAGAPIGTPIYSAMGGRVKFAGTVYGYGKLVILQHKKNYETRYAHLNNIHVRFGQRVPLQTIIGSLGNTGVVTGAHLHFEIRRAGKPIDPRQVTDLHQ